MLIRVHNPRILRSLRELEMIINKLQASSSAGTRIRLQY